jgi:ubiquinone/menaquinone biosynthesis C-methylase UbiE
MADAAFWNGIAARYAAQPVGNPDAFERKIAVTQALMSPEDVVLGIGCGTGSLALRLAGNAQEVHGLDISAEMIRIANGKRDAAGADNVHFHVGAFDQGFTRFGDGSLDGLLAYSILHLVDDHRAALAQIFRLLKPGGYFVSSTVCLGGSWVPYRLILWVMRLFGKAPLVTIMKATTLIADMEAAGFVDIETPAVGAGSTIAFVTARKPR